MNDNVTEDQTPKKNLTRDELANYLKNLKNKAPPKSSLITPPKSPTSPSNNYNNNNNNNSVPSSPSTSSSNIDSIPILPIEKTERKLGGLYGPRAYPSPNKTGSVLNRSHSQKIEENIKTPSSPESVSNSVITSLPPSSTTSNITNAAFPESNFDVTATNKIVKNDEINELINDLTYPMETKLSFKPNNDQSTNVVNNNNNNNNNVNEEIVHANSSTVKTDDGDTKGSYVLSAAFKSYTAASKPTSRTPSLLINKTSTEIQNETEKNKKIYNSTVNLLQKQHQFNGKLNTELKNDNNGGIGNNSNYWSSRYDEAQKKFPQLEKYDGKNISSSNNTINNNNSNNNISNGNNVSNNISENNRDHKRYSTPTVLPSNNKSSSHNNNNINNSNSTNNSRPLSSTIYPTSSLCCASCSKPIAGKVLSAMGKKWHPDHFTCTKCDIPLEHVAFFEKDGSPYCHLDYHELFSPRCGYCDTPIEGQSITALGKSWHVGHFFCRECGGPFERGGFMVHDGFPYCEKDWMNKFAPKCKGCQNPIKGEFTSALDGMWHRDCFVCKICDQPFHSSYYYVHRSQPYCDTHYREVLSQNI